ncbi:MAG: dTDP-4-amino-4,6-dideoxygalactose transaminase [Chloroflexus sp.]|jgi:dTDP-4-amino-4,6-dideoxygalactose transaminase|nr:dTDP-4-amino-4,6-dideoxygalactose transaminase [Chloroflexus sp.]MBO9339834.1 dTDP-4-amino-4,6-dideoxygalactose transaminase [Chloroflexus sp.]
MNRIPFNRPCQTGNEQQYMAQALANGHISGDGPFTKKCHELLTSIHKCAATLLTTSCTHALEMSALLLDIKPGDEVILPSFTFVSTANAFVLRGARPIFADIRPDTLNLDETRLETLITSRTRVIVPVHYAGVGCEMDKICAIAANHGITVVEDNAHGLFGKYRGRFLGTFGALSTLSFHETKNFHCGEGGALIINDHTLVERAEIIREKGTNRSRFFRGQVDKYTWVDIGSSYLPSDLLAAYLLAQLEAREYVLATRRRIYEYYLKNLADWAAANEVQLPFIPDTCESSYHMFYMLLPSLTYRTKLIAHLREHGIMSVFHYLPLHLSPVGRSFGYKEGDCPVTENVSDRLLRLPFYNDLTEDELQRIVATIQTVKWK